MGWSNMKELTTKYGKLFFEFCCFVVTVGGSGVCFLLDHLHIVTKLQVSIIYKYERNNIQWQNLKNPKIKTS